MIILFAHFCTTTRKTDKNQKNLISQNPKRRKKKSASFREDPVDSALPHTILGSHAVPCFTLTPSGSLCWSQEEFVKSQVEQKNYLKITTSNYVSEGMALEARYLGESSPMDTQS